MDLAARRPATVPPAQPGRARRIGRVAWRLARLPLLIYVSVVAVFYAFQTRLIFPGAETQGEPSAQVDPSPDAQLVHLTTAGGDRVVALFGPALTPGGRVHPDAAHRPTILYFYGNGKCLKHVADEDFDRFRRLGTNVLVPEYVGYGMSSGQPGENGCRATADAAYEHLLKRPDVDPSRIVALGRSLGGAVAIDLAARRPVAGLITMSTFTSMLDMARRNFPFLPARLLLRHRFESLAKIGRVGCPILLIHGRRDDLVPIAMMDRLAGAARTPVTRLTVEGAGHNDLFAFGETDILDAIQRFLKPLDPRD
jgi:fermentation-respiration switch protein FrsA (DUF1100 family)